MKNTVFTKDGVEVKKGSNKYKGHIFYDGLGTGYKCLGYFPKLDDCMYVNLDTGNEVVGCMDGFYFNDPTLWHNKAKKGGKYQKGTMIPNNYANKDSKEIWDSWSQNQRRHFLRDHSDEIFLNPSADTSIGQLVQMDYDELITDKTWLAIKQEFQNHIGRGQYGRGGNATDKFYNVDIKYTLVGEYDRFGIMKEQVYATDEEKALKLAEEQFRSTYGSSMYRVIGKKINNQSEYLMVKGGNLGSFNYSIGGL